MTPAQPIRVRPGTLAGVPEVGAAAEPQGWLSSGRICWELMVAVLSLARQSLPENEAPTEHHAAESRQTLESFVWEPRLDHPKLLSSLSSSFPRAPVKQAPARQGPTWVFSCMNQLKPQPSFESSLAGLLFWEPKAGWLIPPQIVPVRLLTLHCVLVTIPGCLSLSSDF